MTAKFKARVRVPNDDAADLILYSEPMTKAEAFELRPRIAAAVVVQLSAIDVIDARGYPVPEYPQRKPRR